MCYKAGHKQVLYFQRGPLQKLQCAGILLSKDPSNVTEMCKYSAFKLHCSSLLACVSSLLSQGLQTAIVMCK